MEDLVEDRRSWSRKAMNPPLIGLIRSSSLVSLMDSSSYDYSSTFFVDVMNLSEGGAMVESLHPLDTTARLELLVYIPSHPEWERHPVRTVWTQMGPDPGQHLNGLEFLSPAESPEAACEKADGAPIPQPSDLEFLLNTKFVNALPRKAVCPLLNCLCRKSVQAGETLISQGDEADNLYLIHRGKCSVKVEVNGELHHVARLREGDVVGEMAVLTGEPRNAHVFADTDLKLWSLSQKQFEQVSTEFPDLRYFLTELLTNRFESQPLYGDRAVGRYVIKHMLGKGGWSIVYHGVHRTLNTSVAVKMLKHNMAMEPGFLEKFRNEAKIIAELSHRNIVRVYDIEELYRTMFIIMEYLDGQSLGDLVERTGPLPIPRAVCFLVQICNGLAYAHEKGIVHQDIKPANIFVLPDDQIRILDFGLACPADTEDLGLSGTIYYAAPEQIRGNPIDARTDIYALGITAFEILAGRRPYPEDDLNALVDMRLKEDIPDPAALVPGLPEALRGFILKACQRKRSGRYQSIREALEDLQPLYDQICRTKERGSPDRRRITTLCLLYQDEQQLALNRLLEELGSKLNELGVRVKTADFEDA